MMIDNYIPQYGLEYYREFNQEQIDLAFLFALGNKDWQLTDFLLNSSKLRLNADVHSLDNGAFKFALINSQDNEALEYLIFKLNIEKTKEIEAILSKINDHQSKLANSMFDMRELSKELLSFNTDDKIFKL